MLQLLQGTDHCATVMQETDVQTASCLQTCFLMNVGVCAYMCRPDLDNYSHACLLLLQGQLLVEGTDMCCCALQYLFNLNLILASSLWQIAGILSTFCVEVFDDLTGQSCVKTMQT